MMNNMNAATEYIVKEYRRDRERDAAKARQNRKHKQQQQKQTD
ncbi:MAG: hypothetical protein ACPG7F_03435 [Aggregatilineales bacterium]